jgi:3,4-dihydroxy 2-butanone 4-phosphate synthase/GTP cyclohydrolase II
MVQTGTKTKGASSIQKIAEFVRPTIFGNFNMISYNKEGNIVFALTKGILPAKDLLVRIQSACLFGEAFGVNSCDCGAQLTEALRIGSQQSAFLLVYLLNQEGRGLGMFQKIKVIEVEANEKVDMATAFERLGLPLDLRDYQVAAEVIRDLNGDQPIRLMTNNPKKIDGLQANGIELAERVPLVINPPNESCRRYLEVKKRTMGHLIPDFD